MTDDLLAAATAAIEAPFGAVIMLVPTDGTPIWIDGRAEPVKVCAAAPAQEDCVWRGSRDTLLRALMDERALVGDFLSGRLVIAGDMGPMARLKLKGWARG